VAALTRRMPDTVGTKSGDLTITGGADSTLFDIVGGNLCSKRRTGLSTARLS